MTQLNFCRQQLNHALSRNARLSHKCAGAAARRRTAEVFAIASLTISLYVELDIRKHDVLL